MTIGAVLAGGRAIRMGRDKAIVEFRGLPMATRVAAALDDAGLDVLFVGRNDSVFELPARPDAGESGRGPAAGLASALAHTGGDVFLTAVDQPMLRPETIRALLAISGDAVVPIANGHPQVTCAVYRAPCLGAVEAAMAAGEMKLRHVLDRVDTTFVEHETWSSWGEDGRSWMSLDTPEALRKAEALR